MTHWSEKTACPGCGAVHKIGSAAEARHRHNFPALCRVPKMVKQSCRSCEHLKVRPDADGKIRIRGVSAYPCTAPFATREELKLPASVFSGFQWPPPTWYMEPDSKEGTTCPAWKKRSKK